MGVLTEQTFIRHLPHRAFVKLSSQLDPGRLWETMAAAIPLHLQHIDDEDAQPRYSHNQIEVFALMGQRAGQANSPTKLVLTDWATKNARVSHLIKLLVRVQFYAAANYLHNELLNLGVIHQADSPDALQNPPVNPAAAGKVDALKQAPGEDAGTGGEKETLPIRQIAEMPLLSQPASDAGGPSSVSSDAQSDHASCFSDHHDSVLAEDGNLLSQLQRTAGHSHRDDSELGWIGLKDIEIQTISYPILSAVTNNFNTEALEKGGNLIGSGGFGKVFLGTFQNGFKIAVKYLMQSEVMKAEDLQLLVKQFETEVKMLSSYRHENVVHLLGYSIDGPTQCLVYQYLPNGSLEDRLARHQGTPPLSSELRVGIVQSTACGIQFLNDKGYVHRDIKTANILLDSNFTAKVGDFATVVMAPSGDGKTIRKVTEVIGTPAYLAPEAVSFDVSTKLDSYSFGVVLLEVLTGLPAQDPRREEPIISNHVEENCEGWEDVVPYLDPQVEGGLEAWGENVVQVLYTVAIRCLSHLKRKRPNVKDVLPELEKL